MRMTASTAAVAMAVAAFVGVVSGIIPSYRASHLGIVDALRHIG
jgi:ABC-type antimicrobial peptide transport system permease subunit